MEEDPVLGGDDLDHKLHQLPRRKPSRLEFQELDPQQLPCHRHWRKSWSSRWSLSIIILCYAISCSASITTTIMFSSFIYVQVCGNQDLALLPLLLKGGGEAEQVCRSNIEKKSLKLTNLSKQTIGCKPGGSLPRLHLTLTTTNWTRFAAFSRGEHWTHWTRMV